MTRMLNMAKIVANIRLDNTRYERAQRRLPHRTLDEIFERAVECKRNMEDYREGESKKRPGCSMPPLDDWLATIHYETK